MVNRELIAVALGLGLGTTLKINGGSSVIGVDFYGPRVIW